jgi:hypothetical protein
MLRRVRSEGQSVAKASAMFGVSRPTFYSALTVTRLRSLSARSGRSHRSRNKSAKLSFDIRCALRLGGFVDRQRCHRNGRKLIGADVARRKDILGDCDRRHRVGPAGVEGKVGDDLRDLTRLHAVVERKMMQETPIYLATRLEEFICSAA